MDFTVTLIGAGNMGGAMLKGWLAGGMPAKNITVIDPNPSDQMVQTLQEAGVRHFVSAEGAKPANVLLVAVKPQMMGKVLPMLTSLVDETTVAVSVAAGTTIETLASSLGYPAAVRAMPNTPSLVERGMTVACPNSQVTCKQRQQVDGLLKAIGRVEWVDDEALIDAVTAVSGSGPAYIFHLAECMAAAGVKAGLPQELAMILARETVSGAGELLRQSDDVPQTLRENVTSPGGTTAAALNVLMRDGQMAEMFVEAIEAAKSRSIELSQD